MTTLGGSLFTFNIMKFDYAAKECIESLLPFCDEVVVLDCESTDDTLDFLRGMASRFSKIKIVPGAKWERGYKHERLAIQANEAISHLSTEWNYMAQADEVTSEHSGRYIREAIASGLGDSFLCRRYNLFGDHNHMVSLTSNKKPCSDAVVRLGRKHIKAMGDAESLDQVRLSGAYLEKIKIFHYGLVRKPQALIEKSIDMQTWFHDNPGYVDKRILKMRDENYFNPYELISQEEIVPLPEPHPIYMKEWLESRSNLQGVLDNVSGHTK